MSGSVEATTAIAQIGSTWSGWRSKMPAKSVACAVDAGEDGATIPGQGRAFGTESWGSSRRFSGN